MTIVDPMKARAAILTKLDAWAATIMDVDAEMQALRALVGGDDGTLVEAIDRLQDAYTDAVAADVGCKPWPKGRDYTHDLDWYRHACQMGTAPLVANGRRIRTIGDLAELIAHD